MMMNQIFAAIYQSFDVPLKSESVGPGHLVHMYPNLEYVVKQCPRMSRNQILAHVFFYFYVSLN